MAMLFGLLLLTLFPTVFAQAKNYSLSPEGAERSSTLYGQFSSQLNETESTSHTTGHSTHHTSERRSTQSTRKSSDLAENSQKMSLFWDHTDGIRGLTSTMSHAKSHTSSREYPSSRNDDPTNSGVTLDYKEHQQSTESTQVSGDDLSHTASQTSSSADNIRSTGIPPYDAQNKESTESPPNKSEDVLITGNRTVYQSTDTILDLTTIRQSTGIPDGHTKDSENIRDLESHTESTQYISTLGNHDYLSSSTKESITSTTQKPTVPPPSKAFYWKSNINRHWTERADIGLCSNSIYYHRTLTTSHVISQELWLDPSQIKKTFVQCELTANLPEGYYVNVTVDQLKGPYDGNFTLTLSEKGEKDEIPSPIVIDSVMLRNTDVSMVSTNPMKWFFESNAPFKPLVVTIHFFLLKGPYIRTLPIFHMSTTVSYVTSPGFNENRKYPNNYDGEFLVNISDGESVLISFHQMFIDYSKGCNYDYFSITDMSKKTEKLCGNKQTWVRVYHSSLHFYFHTNSTSSGLGFKVMFAILPSSELPQRLPGNIFNCSVPHFHLFKPFFSCNLMEECQNGEDEKDCLYGSKGCGEGLIDASTKCYRLVRAQQKATWTDTKNECIRYGMKLATFATRDEYQQFQKLMRSAKDLRYVNVGAQTMSRSHAVSIAALYKHIWHWVDGRTAFSIQLSGYQLSPDCADYYHGTGILRSIYCNKPVYNNFVCESRKLGASQGLYIEGSESILTDPGTVVWNVSVVQCSLLYFTRDFLSCDSQVECTTPDSQMVCPSKTVKMPMFVCRYTRTTVHFTLVCDHVQHCLDNSDEDFCWHSLCPHAGFRKCTNGQCIPDHQMCDGKLDCFDGSDETCSTSDGAGRSVDLKHYPPGIIHLDGKGSYTVEPLNDFEHCPSTHFFCPRDFCLPVYLRCNGIEDCPGREDEAGCDSYTCPGFYRCRGSKVCLHADNVCDGVPQCPEQDDELLCDLSCPDQCHCQGLAFVCSTSFSASSYPALRYLDASGSGMTPGDFINYQYLIHLRLDSCAIISVPLSLTLPNLQEFDLSWNKLIHLDMQSFHNLNNLEVLVLKGNPLIQVTDSASSKSAATKLWNIDLSHTKLQLFNISAYRRCIGLKMLNISWSRITTISDEGFKFTPKLETFDSRGSPVKVFPNDLLKSLQFLKFVQTDNYKLCCEALLPLSFNSKNCHTVKNLIASCEDLLRSNTYRAFLWIFALLSIVGNIGSFAARVYLNTDNRGISSFSMFVTNLSIADFLMGVYLAIIGVADLVYRGEYLWHDDEWKSSAACKIAGFLSLLSSEVSALIICFITLDRLIVLRFPFSRLHFRRTTALITCGAVWFVGLALAAVPLLPMTAHWEFYSQTGICIPLPFASSESFPGYSYSFSVMILLNLVLFLFIAVGQALVFWSIRTNTMSADTSKKSQEIRIARRLITVVVSDFLCWFPIGLLGVLSATGTPIPGEVNVAVAIFVLPFNSALNPFLYTFNVVMEKRNKAQEGHLLRRLESRMHTETSCSCRVETANVAAIQLELNQHVTGDMQDEER